MRGTEPFQWFPSHPGQLLNFTVPPGDGEDEGEVALEVVSLRPRVLVAPGLLTAEECASLRDAALESGMEASEVTNGGETPVRNSRNGWLERGRLPAALLRRLSALLRLDVADFDDLDVEIQTAHYTYGQHYFAHHDGHGRGLTLLLYLNTPEAGGATNFPSAGAADWRPAAQAGRPCSSGVTVPAREGTAVLFYNYLPRHNGTHMWPDMHATHAGCDVLAGEKWLLNFWVRWPFIPLEP